MLVSDEKVNNQTRMAVIRKLYREHYTLHSQIFNELPPECIGITCGAKTRAGTPCKLSAIYINGRCKWHGGLSTGPRTEQGRQQSRINGRKGGRPPKNNTQVIEPIKT